MARIAFAGSPPAAATVLRRLRAAGHDIAMVVSQPDRPKGRRGTPVPTPVSEAASELGLDLQRPASINDEAFLDELERRAVDAICVVGFGQILRDRLLTTWPCVNVHFSVLPAYRGAAPVERALMDGLDETGVTIMQMDAGLDTGPIISIGTISVGPDDDAGDVLDRLARLGGDLLDDALTLIATGALVTTPQPDTGVSLAPKIGFDDIALRFDRGAVELGNRVRALSPHIGAACLIGGERFKVWSVRPLPGDRAKDGVVAIVDGRMLLPCADGVVEVLELQPPGRGRMAAADFLRGWRGGLDLASLPA